MIPSWLGLILLALAAYRTWRLLAEDTILDPVRGRIYRWVDPESKRAMRLYEFLSCPWCLGTWVAAMWWASWYVWPHGTSIVAAPFAVAALVGVIASVVGALED